LISSFVVTLLLYPGADTAAAAGNYLLGAGDRVAVHLRDLKEIEIKPALVQLDGTIDLQHAGVVRAQDLTAAELAREIERRLQSIVLNPKVSVEVIEFGSQPVSVLGAVNKPGVHQLRGRKNLVEVLALAEGMKAEAGNVIKITRPKSSGEIPIPGAKPDASGEYTTAEIGMKSLLDAKTPELNIRIRANDTISVPRAEMVYVLGNVRKPGGFPLAEREALTILQAMALAEGLQPSSAPQAARILRPTGTADQWQAREVRVDVKAILANKAPDQKLEPNDILYIPSSAAKSIGLRALDAGIQIGTGVVIWRR
jgi:polysaccharide biosynthesis/export protein